MSLRSRTLLFGAYLVLVSVWSSSVLRELYAFSRADASGSHLLLIPLVSAALIYHNRARVFSRASFAWRSGLSIVSATLALGAIGLTGPGSSLPGGSIELRVAGLAGSWVGGFLLFYGAGALAAARFPLGFLALMIPIPAALLTGATGVLKVGSAEAVTSLFDLTGTAYHRNGFVFSLSAFVIEIADECSGIRSSIALVLTALILGHWSLKSAWAQILLVAAVVPIAIFKNAVRIVSLTLLALHVDPRFLAGRLHNEGGIVFFLLALALLIPLSAMLRRFEVRAHTPALSAEVLYPSLLREREGP